ncbi:hypothetical protein THOB06_170027 [Vibrio rotiferianus]|nr:hypothetical protein THOG10_170028 [Vibrio rotiferianus]CAH1568604.1 hypothetical protein THOB06_170027 [Vibrio rotiferianus]
MKHPFRGIYSQKCITVFSNVLVQIVTLFILATVLMNYFDVSRRFSSHHNNLQSDKIKANMINRIQ